MQPPWPTPAETLVQSPRSCSGSRSIIRLIVCMDSTLTSATCSIGPSARALLERIFYGCADQRVCLYSSFSRLRLLQVLRAGGCSARKGSKRLRSGIPCWTCPLLFRGTATVQPTPGEQDIAMNSDRSVNPHASSIRACLRMYSSQPSGVFYLALSCSHAYRMLPEIRQGKMRSWLPSQASVHRQVHESELLSSRRALAEKLHFSAKIDASGQDTPHLGCTEQAPGCWRCGVRMPTSVATDGKMEKIGQLPSTLMSFIHLPQIQHHRPFTITPSHSSSREKHQPWHPAQ